MAFDPIKRVVKAVLFVNFSDEDFTGYWDSVPYLIKAGQQIYMEDWKAAHFAKHLIDRELNKKDLPTNHVSRREMLKKAVIVEENVQPVAQSQIETEILNKNEGFSSKVDQKEAKPAEESFEGLK